MTVSTLPKKSVLSRPVLLGVIIIVLVVALVAAYSANLAAHPLVATSIVNSTITVGPGTIQKYTFSVPNGATNAHVSGTFFATGGSGNDIIVHVYDVNGNALYSSGQVSTGNFNVNLSSGSNYSLVFDNTFSTVSPKSVTAQATLNYNR
jgi:sRNA-binding regulator protein Hfq